MSLLVAAAIGCVITGMAPADSRVQIQGKVVSENRSPVHGASITLANGSGRFQTTAGPGGEFTFGLSTPGEYLFEVQQEGYYRIRDQRVQLVEGENEVTLVLTLQREIAESVTVEASPPGIDFSRPSAERVLTSNQIVQVPYASSHSLRHALRVMPAVVHDSQTGLHVDGGAENQLQYSLDGFNVSDPLTGRFDARLSVEAVQAVQLSAGSLAAEHGKGSAGTLAIRTKTGDNRFRYTATNFVPGLSREKGWLLKDWTPRFGIAGPLRKGRAWFSNQADTQYVLSVVEELPPGQDRAPSWRLSNMLHGQVNLTPSHIVTSGFLVNLWNAARTGLSALDPGETTVDRRSRQWFAYVRNVAYLSRGLMMEAGYARNRTYGREIPQGEELLRLTPEGRRGNYFVDAVRGGARDQIIANVYFPAVSARGPHRVKAGLDLDRVSFWQQARRTGYEHYRPDGTRLSRVLFTGPASFRLAAYEASTYVQDSWSPRPDWLIELGLRQDWDRLVRRVNLAPRAGMSWSPGQRRTKLYAGYAVLYDATHLRAFGRPLDQYSIHTSYSPDGSAAREPALNWFSIPRRRFSAPQYSNLSFGLERLLPKRLFLRVHGLRKRGRNGFTYENVLAESRPLSPEEATLWGASRIDALFELHNHRRDVYDSVEILVRQVHGRQYQWMASYRRSRALSNGVMELTIDEPTLVTNNVGRLPWDTPNRLLAWGYFPLGRSGWALASLLEYRDGFPFSVQDGEGRLAGEVNRLRFPAFFELNLHVERAFRWRGKHWAIRAGLLNVTSHRNPVTVNNNMASPHYLHYYGGQRRALNFRVRWLSGGA